MRYECLNDDANDVMNMNLPNINKVDKINDKSMFKMRKSENQACNESIANQKGIINGDLLKKTCKK